MFVYVFLTLSLELQIRKLQALLELREEEDNAVEEHQDIVPIAMNGNAASNDVHYGKVKTLSNNITCFSRALKSSLYVHLKYRKLAALYCNPLLLGLKKTFQPREGRQFF